MRYTVFEYMYRDAANYKVHGSLWLEGELADEDIERFPSLLETDEFFVAEQVSVPTLRSQYADALTPNSDDHVWHTFVRFRSENYLPVDQKLHATCSAFVRRFKSVAGNWCMECSDFYQTF